MTVVTAAHAHDARPSPWIVRFAPLVPSAGRVLDVAAGAGRHARHFAARGHPVLAVDRDAALLAGLTGVANVGTQVADLEGGAWPLGSARFAGVVVTNYLHRPLLPTLATALAPDGVLLYETFMQGNERYGRPSNPAFLLAPGELLDAFGRALRVVAFEQGLVTGPARTAVMQRIALVGPEHAWPASLVPARDAPPDVRHD